MQDLPCGIRAEELSPFWVGSAVWGSWWLIFPNFFFNLCLSKYNKDRICCWFFLKAAYPPPQYSPFCPLLSMNGHSVVPQSVVHFYSATKYAVTALTEGLRQELREAKTHIRATVSTGRVLPLCWLCGLLSFVGQSSGGFAFVVFSLCLFFLLLKENYKSY